MHDQDDRDSFVAPYYYSSQRPAHHNHQPIIPCSSNLLKNAAAMRDSCSDSDSGICADNNSDGQLSPRRNQFINPKKPPPPPPRKPQHLQSLPPYPLKPSQQPQFTQLNRCVLPNEVYNNRIPLIPHNSRLISQSSKTSPGRGTRSTPLRVRFADQVEPSDTSSLSSPSPASSISAPPLYEDACKRIDQLKHSNTPHQSQSRIHPVGVERVDRERVRSRSLPRGASKNPSSQIPSNRVITTDEPSCLSSAKSVDSLVQLAPGTMRNPCVLPAGSCDDIITLDDDNEPLPPPPQFDNCSSFHSLPRPNSSQGKTERTSRFDSTFSHYFGKARGRSQQRDCGGDDRLRAPPLDPHQQPIPKCSSDHSFDRQIRIRLMGLDHRGIHVLELEKLHPGPFGFYISTGVYKRKKGIFISRVTASCLVPLLTVGDQILEVDSEPVKGKNLEQVQLLIAHKSKIVLKLFPVIMR